MKLFYTILSIFLVVGCGGSSSSNNDEEHSTTLPDETGFVFYDNESGKHYSYIEGEKEDLTEKYEGINGTLFVYNEHIFMKEDNTPIYSLIFEDDVFTFPELNDEKREKIKGFITAVDNLEANLSEELGKEICNAVKLETNTTVAISIDGKVHIFDENLTKIQENIQLYGVTECKKEYSSIFPAGEYGVYIYIYDTKILYLLDSHGSDFHQHSKIYVGDIFDFVPTQVVGLGEGDHADHNH